MAFAEVALEQAQTQQTQAQQALQAIRRAYHPYHLETAQPQSTAAVKQQLEQAFTQLEQVTAAASLSQRCHERLQKARRVITDLLATVTFFIGSIPILWVFCQGVVAGSDWTRVARPGRVWKNAGLLPEGTWII